MKKTTFALYFGNRGFFPGELIASARDEMTKTLEKSGFGYIISDQNSTRYGAVETLEEGEFYNNFLKKHEGEYDGIIICLPNFGDENGAYAALKDADVPILVQAYPDEVGKMDFAHRRDALCGKIAMCNVLRQAGIKYTLTSKTAVSPSDESFAEDLRQFGAVCRIVKNLKSFNIGAIGARTTAFKTVRFDEIAMQRKKVNIETIDLSYVFSMMNELKKEDLTEKISVLENTASFGNYPDVKKENLARLLIVLEKIKKQYNLQALAVRCWDELEKTYNIAPCAAMSVLNERHIPSACELDVNNAVMMYALDCASEKPVMLLDVNNNYNGDMNKTVLFHCSAIPQSFFTEKGKISEHLMFKKSYGEGTGVGIVKGKIMPCEVTIGSFKTEDGHLCAFTTEGKLTNDKLDDEFFGCGTVFESAKNAELLEYMCKNGYRHHVAIAKGNWAKAVKEAMENYLEYDIDLI